MFCSRCGHKLEDDWNICPNCGNPGNQPSHCNNTEDPGTHSGYSCTNPRYLGYQDRDGHHVSNDSSRSYRPSPTTIMWGAFVGLGVLGAIIFGGMRLSSGKENPVDIVGDYYVTGCKDIVKVHEGPDEDSNVLTKLSNGEKISLIDKEDDGYWKVYIKAEKIIGYMPDHYLTNERDAVTEPVTRYVDIKSGDTMTIRSLPEEDGAAVGILKRGEKVTLMADMSGDFDYIYAAKAKTYGYVESSGLSRKKVSTAKASDQVTDTPQPTIAAQPQPQPRTQPQVQDRVFGPAAAPVSHLGEYYVFVQKGYLALRNAKAFDSSNEIGQMNNGESVWAMETNGTYWYVYSPSLGMYGYTNSSYLTTSKASNTQSQSTSSYLGVYYANVTSGYLALRNDTAFDAANEIGQIANGAEVDVIDMSAGQYWYVYIPSLGQSGYVNSAYLR